ncbi:MAG: hypothetical protein CMQ68_00150 [Gammaproteobacteria bacterium]|nr:hypothetical protein [Gammaproteobacteria bacterium]|tara:strand:- start:267 stop:455 length:189 start_codon:yes stop_codon:yes gene_type:complete
MNKMQSRMLIEMVARMTADERQSFIEEMDKRFPNLVDDLGSYIFVTQQERNNQLELDIRHGI